MKIYVHGKSDDTEDLTAIFSAETIQSLGESMDAIDVDDESRHYTSKELEYYLMGVCGYDPNMGSSGG